MINKAELRKWAIVLDSELDAHRAYSIDIENLYGSKTLQDAIELAKEEVLDAPVDLSTLADFFMETRVRDIRSLSNALMCFTLLLAGRHLPAGIHAEDGNIKLLP